MNQNVQKKWSGAGRLDSINSTYKHKIHLVGREIPITGYSKPLTEKEAFDKIVLLEKQLIRFVKCGYLFGAHHKYGSKTVKIEYYLNGNYNGKADEPIFTLFPDRYVFHHADFFDDKRLNTFFSRLYEQAKNNEFIPMSLNHKQINASADELFNITKKRFRNDIELISFVEERIREGHPKGQCWDFYVKYTAKWLSNDR